MILQDLQNIEEVPNNNNEIDLTNNRKNILSSTKPLQEGVENYIKFALEIEDSGVGIAEENLDKLFIDFNKLTEHGKLNPTGTGLGLSICKLIVDKMRGHINVKSKPNKGTIFSIVIASKVLLKKVPSFLKK